MDIKWERRRLIFWESTDWLITEELMLSNWGAGEDSSPLNWKEIQPANPKGNQSWIFIGRTGAEAGAPILCCLMRTLNSLEKTLRLGKIEGKKRRRQQMRWLDSITDSMDMNLSKLQNEEGQGSLVCCSLWVAELDTTWGLNNNKWLGFFSLVVVSLI